MNQRFPSPLQPAIISGGLFGLLVALPPVQLVNCCTCCSLVIACGFFASFLYSRNCASAGVEFRPGTGALLGLAAGGVFAVVAVAVDALLTAWIGLPMQRALMEWVRDLPEIPPELNGQIDVWRDALESHESSPFRVLSLIWSLFVHLVQGAVFSTVGGLIGGAVFKKTPRATEQNVYDIPTDAPPSP